MFKKLKVHYYDLLMSTNTRNISSKNIRKHFLDYFVNEHNHKYIPSSSVVPYFDSSIPFVNAGMCQFKNIFLGEVDAQFLSVANSQKCIRVGGKHNDLSVIGMDSYHHTFFEMLGNWSFGSYFKAEACKLAWYLLTTPPFSISTDRLFVTYFGGNKDSNLPADLETREIWLSLGVHPNRIIPFGLSDNFWEMGPTGPCGPSTEIHISHTDSLNSASHLVNKGHPQLTELWNIVFITYQRQEDGSLYPLPKSFVDTGMGFERLVTILQGKSSNYDTDLFIPMFDIITKVTKAPKYQGNFGSNDVNDIDTAYRIVSDFSRMITVAIADHVFPDVNHKLRRILRKALIIIERRFKFEMPSELICKLSMCVAESLGDIYPEILVNLEQVKHVVKHEAELLCNVQKNKESDFKTIVTECPSLDEYDITEFPGLPAAYRHLQTTLKNNPTSILPPNLVYELYDTYGLENHVIDCLSSSIGINVDWESVNLYIDKVKEKSRNTSKISTCIPGYILDILTKTIQKTDDSFKYYYERQECDSVVTYSFPKISAKTLALLQQGEIKSLLSNSFTEKLLNADTSTSDNTNWSKVDNLLNKSVKLEDQNEICIITDKTNFYTEAGGQINDIGKITLINTEGKHINFEVFHVEKVSQCVIHHAKLIDSNRNCQKTCVISVGDDLLLEVDQNQRLNNMYNHTTVHLIVAALKQMLSFTYLKSSKVTHNFLQLSFAVLGEQFTKFDVEKLEEIVRSFISQALPVERVSISGNNLVTISDITLNPGERYPMQNIHIISINDRNNKTVSKEACCGTHVLNTKDIGEFCITDYKSSGLSIRSIKACTGQAAQLTIKQGEDLLKEIKQLSQETEQILNKKNCVFEKVEQLQKKCLKLTQNLKNSFPYIHRDEASVTLRDSSSKIMTVLKSLSKEKIMREIKSLQGKRVKNTDRKFIVYAFNLDQYVGSIRDLISKNFSVPVLIFEVRKGKIKAYCRVPENLVSKSFSANLWLGLVSDQIGAKTNALTRKDSQYACNMASVEIPTDKQTEIVEKLVNVAENIASKYIK